MIISLSGYSGFNRQKGRRWVLSTQNYFSTVFGKCFVVLQTTHICVIWLNLVLRYLCIYWHEHDSLTRAIAFDLCQQHFMGQNVLDASMLFAYLCSYAYSISLYGVVLPSVNKPPFWQLHHLFNLFFFFVKMITSDDKSLKCVWPSVWGWSSPFRSHSRMGHSESIW